MELYSVIKNDRPGNELVWKSPNEDFKNNTQLIVMESEEALFVKDGIVVSTFEGGKYTLNTENYPFIEKLKNAMSDGVSAFNCKVYFVDKTHKMELFWGTDSPIQIRDYEYGFAVGVRARGSYNIEISDSKKFLIKLVGLNTVSYTEENVRDQFRTFFQSKIKLEIATVMKNCKYTILDMNTELENIANLVVNSLADKLDEYGVRLVDFYISDISIPEDDPNYRIINEAYAKAHVGKIETKVQGDDWGRIAAKELMKDIANNPNSGGMANTGAGIGMGLGAAGMFGNLANQMFAPAKETITPAPTENKPSRFAPKKESSEESIKCPNCGNDNSKGSAFCSKCGTKLAAEKYICKNCGKELPNDVVFCSQCGTKREG